MDKKTRFFNFFFWNNAPFFFWNNAPFFSPFAKQWIFKDIPSYGGQSKRAKIATTDLVNTKWYYFNYCWKERGFSSHWKVYGININGVYPILRPNSKEFDRKSLVSRSCRLSRGSKSLYTIYKVVRTKSDQGTARTFIPLLLAVIETFSFQHWSQQKKGSSFLCSESEAKES